MVDQLNSSNTGIKRKPRLGLVGRFIRERREAIGLSQRALGQFLQPAVTTQFISNVERGMTPLPASHIATLAKVLKVEEAEILSRMEQEFSQRISHKVGIELNVPDQQFFQSMADAYRKLSDGEKSQFKKIVESHLKISNDPSSSSSSSPL